MESTSEGIQILSDIEQSIQNALALFNSKDLSEEISQYSIDDPIVSLHNFDNQRAGKHNEKVNAHNEEASKVLSPLQVNEQCNVEHGYNKFPFENKNLPYDSVAVPFLDNPIQNTIEEIQKVLNAKGDGLSVLTEPSPEEILNLYSQDLGISISNNTSPRGEFNISEKQLNDNDIKVLHPNKKDKKNYNKKLKQQKTKLNKENKIEIKKLEILQSRENKLRELRNIYGCSDKTRKPKSDSTLGSKSGVSKNSSAKKLISMNNVNIANSIAPSKKSKRKSKLYFNEYNSNMCDEDFPVVEKSSKLSTKRKQKQKNNNKVLKKTNLKRKVGTNLVNDNVELKLNKPHQIPLRDNNNMYKISNTNYFVKNNNFKPQKKINSGQTHHRLSTWDKGLSNIENNLLTRNNNKTTSNTSYYTKQQYEVKNNLNYIYSDIQNPIQKDNILKTTDSGKYINKKLSDEAKINKSTLFEENGAHNSNNYIVNNSDSDNCQLNYDCINEDLNELSTQLHYALPTQSSRSKEVERFLSEHYQHLPFVIGQSTNKSHNLWVNIQEALSLIKQKIPLKIETQNIVQDTESERPISVFSKMTMKSNKHAHDCPAVIADSLYDIPEGSAEVEETVPKSWEDHPECLQANIDPNYVRPRCSCLSQPSLSYKKVLRQLFGAVSADESDVDMNRAKSGLFHEQGGNSYITELQKALVSFTQEFEELNNKYEEMLSDPNVSKDELQRVEMQLENKEKEIREIITRFNEVKEINERTRLQAIKSRGGFSNLGCNKSTTSVRLVHTLRRVQQLKESLISKSTVPFI